MAKQVQDVLEELAQANYVGDIQAIVAIFINKENEIEISSGFSHEHIYRIISGLEILKYNLMKDISENAAKKPKDRS